MQFSQKTNHKISSRESAAIKLDVLAMPPRDLSGLPVSSGNGKCCNVDDLWTPGCDPIGIKEWEKDPRFKDYGIKLVCTHAYDDSRDAQPYGTYKES